MNIEKEKVLVAWLSVLSNSTLVVLKIIIGVLIGSVSVISEAIHSGVDLIAAVIALFAVKNANRPADDDHPYGHGKYENISGTIEAILIFVAAIWIIIEAVEKLKNPKAIDEPGWGIAIMLISAIVNWIVSGMLFKVGKKAHSVALEADAWHLRTDVYTSLGVMFGLLGIWITEKLFAPHHFHWIDPVAAIFVALLIIKAAYDLTLQAGKDLFDISLPTEELEWINKLIDKFPEVKNHHDLRSRKAGMYRFVEFHLVVDGKMTVTKSSKLVAEITREMQSRFPEIHVTIHFDPY